MAAVVACLTTIPPRSGTVTETLRSLAPQVKSIYLYIPWTYRRFGPAEPPEYPGVTVVRGEDYGPASKYLGCLHLLPPDQWMFICDDDQVYHPTLVARMLANVRQPAVYQNNYARISQDTSGGAVHGFVGTLVQRGFFDASVLPLPSPAYNVDDQYMSIYFWRRGIPVLPSGVEGMAAIFAELQDGHERWGCAALSGDGYATRQMHVAALEKDCGVRFRGIHIEKINQNTSEKIHIEPRLPRRCCGPSCCIL